MSLSWRTPDTFHIGTAVWTHSSPLWTCYPCAASSCKWVWRMSSAWPYIWTERPSIHHQAFVCALSLIHPREQKIYTGSSTESNVLFKLLNLQYNYHLLTGNVIISSFAHTTAVGFQLWGWIDRHFARGTMEMLFAALGFPFLSHLLFASTGISLWFWL